MCFVVQTDNWIPANGTVYLRNRVITTSISVTESKPYQRDTFMWYFLSKVNIWNVNCARAAAFIFDTRTSVLVKVSETENVSTWGGLGPPTYGFMPNALTYCAIRARHLLSHVFEHWLSRYRYFSSKVYIWNVNCARATAFIFDTRTSILVKVSKCLRQKMSRPEGGSLNLRIHAECSKLLSYPGQRFAVPCFWTLALSIQIFFF